MSSDSWEELFADSFASVLIGTLFAVAFVDVRAGFFAGIVTFLLLSLTEGF